MGEGGGGAGHREGMDELKNKEVKSKNIRVEKAQLKSATARLNHCTLSDRKRKKDWQ